MRIRTTKTKNGRLFYVIKTYYDSKGVEHSITVEKLGKGGFGFGAVSSSSMIVNANRFQMHCLAYNLFNWFRRLVLPSGWRKHHIDTIRIKLLKIAARAVHSARYIHFRLSSSCPYNPIMH